MRPHTRMSMTQPLTGKDALAPWRWGLRPAAPDGSRRLIRWLGHPYLLLTLTMLFWAGATVLGRGLRGEVPPVALAFWRWAIALALLLPLATPHVRPQGRLLTRGWLAVTVLGLFGIGGYNTLAYIALQHTTATNALLINACMPVAIRALSRVVLGTRLRGLESVGVALACGGVATIVCRGDARQLAHLTFNVGDLWMLAAVLTWALYTVGLHWRPAGVDPQLMLAALIVVGLTVIAPAYAWEIWSGRVIHVTPRVLLGLGYTGLCAGFLGFLCYNRGVREVGAHRAGVFLYLLPVFGTLLAALWLGERPQGYHYAGITLIFAGIWLTTVASHGVVSS